MSVTRQQIKTLARLARLDFDDEKCEEFAPRFEEIIAFADTINNSVEGDTDTIREVIDRTAEWKELREDVVEESLPQGKILSNVDSENGYFPVKRVVK